MGVRRWLEGAAIGLGAIAGLAAFGLLADCWRVAGDLVDVGRAWPFKIHVLEVGPDTVTLSRPEVSGRPGLHGLLWRAGPYGQVATGVLGEVLRKDARSATRRLKAATAPPAGVRALQLVVVWPSNPRAAFGLDYREVRYPTPLGPMPAWFVPGSRSTWVIQCHGHDSDRTEGLRYMPALHALGFPILDIAYRNGSGAPPSPDHYHHLGDTEWEDLEAAVDYALAQSATRVILCGYSMGGAVVGNYLERGHGAGAVKAIIFDAPVLDWMAVFDFQTQRNHLPRVLGDLEAWMLRRRAGIDLKRMNVAASMRCTGGPPAPVLLFHGTEDTEVPFSLSAQFANEWPGRVRLVPVEGAKHDEAWNVDPDAYDRTLREFLSGLNAA